MACLAFVISILVGMSRVVVGCHYPTDVLCGWMLGLVVMFFVSVLYGRVKNMWVRFGILAVVCGVGMFYCNTNDYFTSYGLLVGLMLSEPFEKKFVNFETTRNPVKIVIRILVGGMLYIGLNTVLKLPFSEAFLESGTHMAHLVRTVRYIIDIFVIAAIYPMLFKLSPIKEKAKT